MKNQYTADFYVNLTDAIANNSSTLTDMVVPPKVSYEFTLHLPEKSLSNNATNVSKDGKTLTWQFDNITSGTNNINSLYMSDVIPIPLADISLEKRTDTTTKE